jgi:hypothetical protein
LPGITDNYDWGKIAMNAVIENNFSSPGFSARTSYYMACASCYAYQPDSGDWAEKLGLEDRAEHFTSGQFHGFVGFLDGATLIAFRGTQSVANCLTDAETSLVARPAYPGKVHLGFVEAVEETLPCVRKLLPPPARSAPLWISGHSLGGAMATLTSVRLAEAGYSVRAVYTYGSPRVGDRNFRDAYRGNNYRFVYGDDLVPHLPFRWCYKHVGRLKLLDNDGNLIEGDSAWREKKRALAGHAKWIQHAHRHKVEAHNEHAEFDWLADHHLNHYLDAITKFLQKKSRQRRFDRSDDHSEHHSEHRSEHQTLVVPTRIYRIDPGLQRVPPPAKERMEQRQTERSEGSPSEEHVISDEALITSFFDQPRGRSWQAAARSSAR